ncbi:heavy metal-binding domain-containing protein [Dickeya sp. CFBP 2040]|uniref:heavy metal-binding domain-containing protein n=1 Tax=Dickeya sp. CFBP 2040 TaxID=2718531 RepID=UPI001445D489|nr:heavy metal-binding domain-containing protein [Dickeya sp. CFBP 2040]NKI73074.1 heavy metal-binding domain-containing protein [Dickeya sp. CFBP 2040]
MQLPTISQLSTTSMLEGHVIETYCGVITGKTIPDVNIFQDFFAGISNIVGGRFGAYEKERRYARQIAFREMQQQDKELVGMDTIVGIDIDYETVGKDRSMLMVSVGDSPVMVRLS